MKIFVAGNLSRLSSPGMIDESLEDDDIEVDVEECSDGESNSRPTKTKSPLQSPAISDCGSETAELDRDSPELLPEKPLTRNKLHCNCEELLSVDCHLETKDLWDKFHDLGTEMIITKTGRWVKLFNFLILMNYPHL